MTPPWAVMSAAALESIRPWWEVLAHRGSGRQRAVDGAATIEPDVDGIPSTGARNGRCDAQRALQAPSRVATAVSRGRRRGPAPSDQVVGDLVDDRGPDHQRLSGLGVDLGVGAAAVVKAHDA